MFPFAVPLVPGTSERGCHSGCVALALGKKDREKKEEEEKEEEEQSNHEYSSASPASICKISKKGTLTCSGKLSLSFYCLSLQLLILFHEGLCGGRRGGGDEGVKV